MEKLRSSQTRRLDPRRTLLAESSWCSYPGYCSGTVSRQFYHLSLGSKETDGQEIAVYSLDFCRWKRRVVGWRWESENILRIDKVWKFVCLPRLGTFGWNCRAPAAVAVYSLHD